MEDSAFQVIVLGPTGGPQEDVVTGLLVRSTSTNWSKSSLIAVDAGTLLSGIVRILNQTLTIDETGIPVINEGPFFGLQPPHKTSQANAAYIFREVIASVLITHPHLDHLSGLAINTPIVEASNGPKTVAGLPSVISAMKNHMFNDIIWPNLSDEDGGAGLITYQRLVEGGNPRFGCGESRGYVRVGKGLVIKCLSISHGRCKQRYDPESGRHHRVGSAVFGPDQMVMTNGRTLSMDQSDGAMCSPTRSPLIGSNYGATPSGDAALWATVESSAFFIRDDNTGREIIIFGDIEPDSVSLEPRNKFIWEIAAPKIANGILRAIFIECSYSDAVDDETLYGHLCPRHLIAELKVLADKVEELKPNEDQREKRRGRSSKRKRKDSGTVTYQRDQPGSPRSARQVSHNTTKPGELEGTTTEPLLIGNQTPAAISTIEGGSQQHNNTTTTTVEEQSVQSRVNDEAAVEAADGADQEAEPGDNDQPSLSRSGVQSVDSGAAQLLLAGFKVFIIHVKDTLVDGPHPGVRILEELRAQAGEAGLGCEFHVPYQGEGIFI